VVKGGEGEKDPRKKEFQSGGEEVWGEVKPRTAGGHHLGNSREFRGKRAVGVSKRWGGKRNQTNPEEEDHKKGFRCFKETK